MFDSLTRLFMRWKPRRHQEIIARPSMDPALALEVIAKARQSQRELMEASSAEVLGRHIPTGKRAALVPPLKAINE